MLSHLAVEITLQVSVFMGQIFVPAEHIRKAPEEWGL